MGNEQEHRRAVARIPPNNVESLRRLILAEPALQRRLGRHTMPEAFVEDVLAIAAASEMAIGADDLYPAIRADPVGIGRFAAAPVTLDRWPHEGWMPAHSIPGAPVPLVDWAWFGSEPLQDPFYEDVIRRAAARPLSLFLRTRTPVLVDDVPSIWPDGLIFHMSRCGSTLAAQMLAAVPDHHVVSEPAPLDDVIQWASISGESRGQQVQMLRAAISAIGRRPHRRFFVKLDSWHTLALPLFRAAFPDTPWIFLFRDPIEVMVSQLGLRGLQTIPGGLPEHVLRIENGENMSAEDHCALVLNRLCSAAVDHWHLGGGLAIDYADLGAAMLERIPRHFGFDPTPDERALMLAAASRDAKAPNHEFVPDGDRKRSAASAAAIAAVERHLTETMMSVAMLAH